MSNRTRPAVVFYTDDSRVVLGFARAGRFLPRGTYPAAVLTIDDVLTKIVDVEIPREIYAAAYAQTFEHAGVVEIETIAFRSDDLLALDVSGSTDAEIERLRAFAFEVELASGARVVVFADRVASLDDIDTLGSGTSYSALAEYVASLTEPPSRVFVLTDGQAPHIAPPLPERWFWLITPGGDPWPAERTRKPMTVFHVTDVPNRSNQA